MVQLRQVNFQLSSAQGPGVLVGDMSFHFYRFFSYLQYPMSFFEHLSPLQVITSLF